MLEDLERLRDDCEELRNLAIIDILNSTGMRVGELERLDIDDVDFDERECIVLGKGEKKENGKMEIRRIKIGDENQVSNLIRKTICISNIKDYPKELMDALIAVETPEHVLERASWTHFYVVIDEDEIIGCGAIGPYWGKEDESSLFTIFVLPDHQGKGIGRKIVETLENDEYGLRANRIEIPASITGVPFYLKMGYEFKNGNSEPDEEHLIRMEKKKLKGSVISQDISDTEDTDTLTGWLYK